MTNKSNIKSWIFGIFVVLVLVVVIGYAATNPTENTTNKKTIENIQTLSDSNSEDNFDESDVKKAIEVQTKISEVRAELNNLEDSNPNVDLAKSLLGIAQKNYDKQKYDKALDLTLQAESLISGISALEYQEEVEFESEDDDDEDEEEDEELSREETRRISGIISEEQAIEIALDEVGRGRVVEVESEREKGRIVYGVEIKDGSDEIEVEIDAETGEVIEVEINED